MAEYYITTKETQQKLFKANLTAAEWRLYSYFAMIDPFGDNYREIPDAVTIMQEVGVKKSTFYSAIAKFQDLELFDFHCKSVTLRNLTGSNAKQALLESSDSPDSGNIPKFRNFTPENRKIIPKFRNDIQENGTDSKQTEYEAPKPLQDKDSKTPHTNQTIKDLKDTTDLRSDCTEFKNKPVLKSDRTESKNKPVLRSDRNQEQSRGSVIEIFEKYKEQLNKYGVYLLTYQNELLQLNPKIEPVIQQAGCLPSEKVEPVIRAFITWIRQAKDVKEPYRAFYKALKEKWEEL